MRAVNSNQSKQMTDHITIYIGPGYARPTAAQLELIRAYQTRATRSADGRTWAVEIETSRLAEIMAAGMPEKGRSLT